MECTTYIAKILDKCVCFPASFTGSSCEEERNKFGRSVASFFPSSHCEVTSCEGISVDGDHQDVSNFGLVSNHHENTDSDYSDDKSNISCSNVTSLDSENTSHSSSDHGDDGNDVSFSFPSTSLPFLNLQENQGFEIDVSDTASLQPEDRVLVNENGRGYHSYKEGSEFSECRS